MSTHNNMQHWLANSYLSGSNADYLEELYEQYLQDPNSIDTQWQDYFKHLPHTSSAQPEVSHAAIQQQFRDLAQKPQKSGSLSGDAAYFRKQGAVSRLIEAYRIYGHLTANINPIGAPRAHPPELALEYYPELSRADQNVIFETDSLLTAHRGTLNEILDTLSRIYCGTTGIEYMYIRDPDERNWVRHHFEEERFTQIFSTEEKMETLKLLVAADGLEKYLAHRYVGQKRFSLEGGDSFIPFVHMLNQEAAAKGIKEIVIGMAHRGRLNILVNIFGKPPEELFQEFEGRKDYGLTSADVKYHLGQSSDVDTKFGPLHLSLAFNPSHLEIISPVLMGSVRARQQKQSAGRHDDILGLIVHGDSALAGQGIVMETLSMSQTNAYKIGGQIHVVINNQVGFTTSDISDTRSSTYCTDIAKMIDAPVIHVNGDDPEAVVRAARLAVDYRQKFQKDVFVDLVCYRRLGHNEADEPAATQPLMYRFIRQHLAPREIYAQKLINEKICTSEEVEKLVETYRTELDTGNPVTQTHRNGRTTQYSSDWVPYIDQEWTAMADTSVPLDKFVAIAKKVQYIPEDFQVQRQVSHILEARVKMAAGEQPIDWGYAETMAYATLLEQGYPIRMSGQDCQRGTFAHRHAVLHDQQTDQTYVPLTHVSNHQALFQIYNSLLSEAGAMGFEYGYASTDPKTLTLWEAQYGDFANGAQVIVDQFMSSAWQKWNTLSGLTLLLPHGYEGAGPEHTSARLECYLQLCAQNNMQVCMPTTPAQIFHLLRRQVIRPCRLPLIVMSPKSILRNKLAVSTLTDLTEGGFQLVIPEVEKIPVNKVTRVVLCSGKVYYDLLVERQKQNLDHVAIIRVEQLYPFPKQALEAELKRYKKTQDIVWCQEEPVNQGSWYVLYDRLVSCLAPGQKLCYVGREASASPAAGYMKLHLKEQTELVNQALKKNEGCA